MLRSFDTDSLLKDPTPFATQKRDQQIQCEHKTIGVDLCITPDRIILLDTQPFLSPSILLNIQKMELPLGDLVVSHEHLLHVQVCSPLYLKSIY